MNYEEKYNKLINDLKTWRDDEQAKVTELESICEALSNYDVKYEILDEIREHKYKLKNISGKITSLLYHNGDEESKQIVDDDLPF